MGPLALLCEYERAALAGWLSVVAQEAFLRSAHTRLGLRAAQKIAIGSFFFSAAPIRRAKGQHVRDSSMHAVA